MSRYYFPHISLCTLYLRYFPHRYIHSHDDALHKAYEEILANCDVDAAAMNYGQWMYVTKMVMMSFRHFELRSAIKYYSNMTAFCLYTQRRNLQCLHLQ